MKSQVRLKILKAFYENLFGSDVPSSRAFQGASFEEYYALLRRFYPNISRWKAANRSKIPELNKLAETFPPDPDPSSEKREKQKRIRAVFRRKNTVDLALEKLPEGLQSILLDRIKEIGNFSVLAQKEKLDTVNVILCGSRGREIPAKAVSISELRLFEPQYELMRTVLSTVSPTKLTLAFKERPVFDLRWLPISPSMNSLWIEAGMVKHVDCLASSAIVKLMLSNTVLDDVFRTTLQSMHGTLQSIRLHNSDPFLPGALPPLDSMETLLQVTVPAYPEHKEEWVDFAVSHPGIDFRFPSPDSVVLPKQSLRLFSVYRNVDILSEKKGRSENYLICINFAGDILGQKGSNHEIADYLKQKAVENKKRFTIHSSSDELMIHAKKFEDCLWAVDRAYEMQ